MYRCPIRPTQNRSRLGRSPSEQHLPAPRQLGCPTTGSGLAGNDPESESVAVEQAAQTN